MDRARFCTQALAIGACLLPLPLSANSLPVDLFLADDYSLDPEALGYHIVAPPPTAVSTFSQRLEGGRKQGLTALTTRLRSRLQHPFSESMHAAITVEANLNAPVRWDRIADDRLQFQGRVDEAALHFEEGRWQLAAGWQESSWGTVEGARVLDVLSPQTLEVTEYIGGRKQPQLSIQGSVRIATLGLSAWLFPDPLATREAQQQNAQNGTKAADPGFALQLSSRAPRSVTTLHLARLSPDTPVLVTASEPETRDPYWLFGLSSRVPVGPVEWRGELAYKSSLYPADTPTPSAPIPSADASVHGRLEGATGLRIITRRFGEWEGFMTARRWFDDQALIDTEAWQNELALSWLDSWYADRISTRLSVYGSFSDAYLTGVARTSWHYDHGSELSLTLTQYFADDGTPFADRHRQTRYLAQWQYRF